MENIRTQDTISHVKNQKPKMSSPMVPISTPIEASTSARTPLSSSSGNELSHEMHSSKSAVQLSDSLEKPDKLLRAPSRRISREKSRSMTEAEIAADYVSSLELLQLNERLRSEGPPKSLDEARQEAHERRASIKEERKASIEFIRHRTSSRAAQMGRPHPSVQEGILLEARENPILSMPHPEGKMKLDDESC